MIKKLLTVFVLFAFFSVNAQTDLKVTLRKMNSAYMKGPELEIDSATKTIWVGANYIGEKIEDATLLETKIENLTTWCSKYTLTTDSTAADIVVNIDFSDLICDNPFMDWNTSESSFFYRMRYYVPTKVTLLNKIGEEIFSGDFPIRSVMKEIFTGNAKSEIALKGLVSEPVLITDANSQEKTFELFKLQKVKWDPILSNIKDYINLEIAVFEGVMPRKQNIKVHNQIQNLIDNFTNLELSALHRMTNITGSIFISLCVLRRDIFHNDLFEICFLDELWQAREWGFDEEASTKRGRISKELNKIVTLIDFLRIERNKV